MELKRPWKWRFNKPYCGP